MTKMLAALAFLLASPAMASLDGTPSTGSFTVLDSAKLVGAKATGSLTVLSTTVARNCAITVGPNLLREGQEWRVGASVNAAATSLSSAINAVKKVVAVPSSNVAGLTALSVGSNFNAISLKTTCPLGVSTSAAAMSGGQDDATLSVNFIGVKQGRDFLVDDTSSGTAVNIAVAINESPALGPIVEAMPISTQVYLRSRQSGAHFTLASTMPAGAVASGAVMTGGTSGNLKRFKCDLGRVATLPLALYPAGCSAFQLSDSLHYVSTETVVGLQSWLAE